MVDDSWLLDLFAGEDSPGDSVDLIIFDILDLLSIDVNSLVANSLRNTFEVLGKHLHDGMRNEELEVGFLVYIAISRSPSVLLIGRISGIDLWLRIDCEHSSFIHLD